MKKHILAGFILLAIPVLAFSQNTDTTPTLEMEQSPAQKQLQLGEQKSEGNPENKGEELYQDMAYLSSADYFLKKDAKGELSMQDKEKLANSYRLNGMSEDAEYWYSQIINTISNPTNKMYYAEMLQSNGKCEDAARWFKIYQEESGDKTRTFIEDCDDAIPELEGVAIYNIESLNTRALDFSPILYKNGLVFSSTREQSKSQKNTDKWTKGKFSDLFFAEKSGESFSKVKPLNGVNKKFHDGTATFNRSGNYMIFTRTSKKGKSSKGIRELKLYEATLDGDKWTDVKKLSINNNEFATCHPTLSADGRRLYFSSNRPGGYGGMDIYMCQKLNGGWTEPVNLGPVVNSSGNEVFPYMNQDEKLYFSSNGHKGVGGLDIFVAEKTDLSNESSWSSRSNLGKPFNSKKDDVGFTMQADGKTGYLSSNRPGGQGKDDIYHWKMDGDVFAKTEKPKRGQSLCVYNIQTNEKMEGVNVSVLPGDFQNNPQDMTLTLKPSKTNKNEYVLGMKEQGNSAISSEVMTTDEFGKFKYPMEKNADYFFVLTKKGFGTVQHQTNYEAVTRRDDYCIAMAPRTCKTMSGVVNNQDYNRPVPFADVEMFNRCTGETTNTRADEAGQFELCVDCDCEYELVVQKERFSKNQMLVSTINQDCESSGLENVVVNLTVADRNSVQENNSSWSQNSTTQRNSTTWTENSTNRNTSTWNENSTQRNSSNSNQNSNQQNNSDWEKYAVQQSNNQVQQHPFENQYAQSSNYGSNGNSTANRNPAPLRPNENSQEELMEYFTGDAENVITVGQKLTLKNVYYNFDKAGIRPDAAVELDYVAQLMTMQPTMEIALFSHTDLQGGYDYNQELSEKRAESAEAYLISRGVSPNRIKMAKGMGETQPIAPCENCSNEQHQINRRTEITVLKI